MVRIEYTVPKKINEINDLTNKVVDAFDLRIERAVVTSHGSSSVDSVLVIPGSSTILVSGRTSSEVDVRIVTTRTTPSSPG